MCYIICNIFCHGLHICLVFSELINGRKIIIDSYASTALKICLVIIIIGKSQNYYISIMLILMYKQQSNMYFFSWFFRRFDPELLYASEHHTKSCTCTVHTVFKSELIISPSYLSHLNKDFYFFHNILHVNLKLLVLDQFIKN